MQVAEAPAPAQCFDFRRSWLEKEEGFSVRNAWQGAPVDGSNVANYNVVDILNDAGSKRMTRRKTDLATANAPATVADVANDNFIADGNHVR
ncbi:hypothetical protein HWV62_30931 [Athelia sp. TMB]|nr:hypothetical protein HWV62_30931 [Athelia sp. TMB]